MSEHQGKVIDGTARGHWRRSSFGSPADADATQGHSEAPKSIASSLLVPAQMLLEGSASAAPTGTEDRGIGEGLGEHPSGLVPRAPAAEEQHVNLFLTHGSVEADTTRRPRGTRRRELLARLRRCTEHISAALRLGYGPPRSSLMALRRQLAGRPVRIAATTLGATVALILVLALFGTSRPAGHVREHARDEHASMNLLESLRSDSLAVSANPFGDKTAHRQFVNAHRSHLATAQLSAVHHSASRAHASTRVRVTQQVATTPSPPVNTYTAPDTETSRTGSTTPTASPPAASQTNHSEETPVSHSPPAGPTGAGALLGPGHCSC